MMDPVNSGWPSRALALARFEAGLKAGDYLAKSVGAKCPGTGFGYFRDDLRAQDFRDLLDVFRHISIRLTGKFKSNFEVVAVDYEANRALPGFSAHPNQKLAQFVATGF